MSEECWQINMGSEKSYKSDSRSGDRILLPETKEISSINLSKRRLWLGLIIVFKCPKCLYGEISDSRDLFNVADKSIMRSYVGK